MHIGYNYKMQVTKRLSLYIFYGLLAYMPFHILLSTAIGTGFGILEPMKVLKDIVLVLGFGLVFITSHKAGILRQFFKDKLVLLVIAFATLNVLLAIFRPTDKDAEILGLVYNTRFLLFFLYAILLSKLFDAKKIFNTSLYLVLVATALVAFFGIVQYTVLPDDALRGVGYSRENGVLPAFFIDDKPDLERAMSTVRDPNSLGSYLIIGSMLALAFLLMAKKREDRVRFGSLLAASLICLWFTFSRSALLGFTLALAVFLIMYGAKLRPLLRKYKKPLIFGALSAFIAVTAGLAVFWNSYTVQNVLFHADDSTVLEDPNELRIKFWKESVDDIVADPAGSGPGTAGLASIRNEEQGTELNENYYLQMGSELGIVGLGIFLGILALVGKRLYDLRKDPYVLALLASFIGLALTNFLVHIWANEAVSYTWWGLAGLAIAFKPLKSKSRNTRRT